jgi:hypothetical protein
VVKHDATAKTHKHRQKHQHGKLHGHLHL